MEDMTVGQAVELLKGYAKQHRAVLAVQIVLNKINNLEVEERRLEKRIKELDDDHKKYTNSTNLALHKLQEDERKIASL